MVRGAFLVLSAALVMSGCSSSPGGGSGGDAPTADDPITPPQLGQCRVLEAADVAEPSNGTEPVPCSEEHTAETFAVGTLPERTGSSYDDDGHGRFVHRRCTQAFRSFLGADESLALRTLLSWVWFRPSEKAWDEGARWYRCDVVGRVGDKEDLRKLPKTAKGLFTRDRPDEWLTCARGAQLAGSTKVACSEAHHWRAVTAVKVGDEDETWPGEKIVQARSRDRCSDWVGAWLNYTPDYDYGYTWFHEAEWEAGNRRSVCWSRTAD